MSRKKELQRQLGSRYSYERLLSDREIQKLQRDIPTGFSETAAAVLTAGCLRLNAVLYRSCKKLLLGYDVFVKDDPGDLHHFLYYIVRRNPSLICIFTHTSVPISSICGDCG